MLDLNMKKSQCVTILYILLQKWNANVLIRDFLQTFLCPVCLLMQYFYSSYKIHSLNAININYNYI